MVYVTHSTGEGAPSLIPVGHWPADGRTLAAVDGGSGLRVPAEERRERARKALERVGLAKRIDNRPNQLSGGQQQRVAVARAIINRPAMLLADEPTGALDSRTTEEVLAIFDDLNGQGITILLVTHEQEVGDRARRVVHFRDGRLAG